LKLYYKGRALKKTYIPDLFVFERIIVELKAVSAFCPEHEA
jgi:GxxExxY protein